MSEHKILKLTEYCTGCFACSNICPKDAISLPENQEGFYFPTIDTDLCIDCGLCDKICPQITMQQTVSMQKAYYGWAKNDDIRKTSSSGGIFSRIASLMMKQDGIIYGASFNYEGVIRLECHSTKEVSLKELQRSKYVQSYIGNTFRLIKKDLETGHKVVFCGTPCQVAGLKSYLRKSYDKLVLIDFVCHGVPSMSLLRLHLDYLGIKNIREIIFRPKNTGWVDDIDIYYSKVDSPSKASVCLHRTPWVLDEYFYMFQTYKSIRRSCRNCSYCNGQRASDISLADFWGIKKYKPELWDIKGNSLILANTQKGINIIENLKNNENVIFELPLKYAAYVYERIRTLPDSPYQNEERDLLIHDIYSKGYKEALLMHDLKTPLIAKIKHKSKVLLRSILKRNRL